MCDAVQFTCQNQPTIVNFQDTDAALLVRLKNSRYQYVPWGNKLTEERFPIGGVAHIDQINSGQWDRYRPKPVKISFDRYMQISLQGEECWFENDIKPNRHLQGLLAFVGTKHRVYIVVRSAELFDADTHKTFPVRVYQPDPPPF